MGLQTTMAIGLLDLTLEDKVSMHLRGNIYPPVPLSMVQPCVEAIDAYLDEDYSREIQLPEGISWKGITTAPAHAIVEGHRLDGFLMQEDWDEE